MAFNFPSDYYEFSKKFHGEDPIFIIIIYAILQVPTLINFLKKIKNVKKSILMDKGKVCF